MIECAGNDLEESIKRITRASLKEKIHPKEWKKVKIKSISKGGKKWRWKIGVSVWRSCC